MPKDIGNREFEKRFRDPYVGDKLLKPPMSGVACTNIRIALRLLGYDVAYGDQYDQELAQVVLRFQNDYEHSSRDGFFGPGTRQLLTKVLVDKRGPEVFTRLAEPTEHEVLLQFGRFFRDPSVGDGLLKPPMSGVACANIRTALRRLDYDVAYGDQYDKELAQVVLRFQNDYKHSSRDGLFGPGTRRLLVIVLVEKYGTQIFNDMQESRKGAVVKTVSDQELAYFKKLHQILSERFDVGELRTLCLYLGVDYEDLSGGGKKDKARELIIHLKNRNLVYKLEDNIRDMRPDIPWDSS